MKFAPDRGSPTWREPLLASLPVNGLGIPRYLGRGGYLRPNWLSSVTYALPVRQYGQSKGRSEAAYQVDFL